MLRGAGRPEIVLLPRPRELGLLLGGGAGSLDELALGGREDDGVRVPFLLLLLLLLLLAIRGRWHGGGVRVRVQEGQRIGEALSAEGAGEVAGHGTAHGVDLVGGPDLVP